MSLVQTPSNAFLVAILLIGHRIHEISITDGMALSVSIDLVLIQA